MKLPDWETEGLGPAEGWHPLLNSTAHLVLKSKTPMLLAWGQDLRLFFNENFARILGPEWRSALGTGMAATWASAWPHFERHVAKALSGEGVLIENFAVPTQRSGFAEMGYFSFAYTPIMEFDQVLGLLCVCSETTSAVQNEERLQRLQADLIHLSRWSAMESMASSLAHEVNQPLTAIAGYIWAAQRLLDSISFDRCDEMQAALDGANASVMRAGDIVKRARELLKKHSAKQVPVDGVQLLEEMRALILPEAKRNGVKLVVEAPQELTLVADARMIQQALLSIVKNAIEAMSNSKDRQLLIVVNKGAEAAKFSICDTGPGFSPDARASLFSAFKSTKQDYSGLGLSISRTIIEANHGRIWLEETSAGAEICFTLPLAH